MVKIKIYTFILFLFSSNILFAQSGESTVMIFVRHAEKDTNSPDPSLTDRGKQRAEFIAKLLQDEEIASVCTTPYNRTRETGRFIAEKHNLKIEEYNPSQKGLIQDWKNTFKGKTVVVVGHSNTIPMYLNELLKENKFSNLAESDYDKLFIVSVPENGIPSFVILNTSAFLVQQRQ